MSPLTTSVLVGTAWSRRTDDSHPVLRVVLHLERLQHTVVHGAPDDRGGDAGVGELAMRHGVDHELHLGAGLAGAIRRMDSERHDVAVVHLAVVDATDSGLHRCGVVHHRVGVGASHVCLLLGWSHGWIYHYTKFRLLCQYTYAWY